MTRFAALTVSDYEAAKLFLSYNPITGKFTWIKKASKKTIIGSEAGSLSDQGYIIIRVNGIKFRAHRLAWYFYYNKIPFIEVDHEDTIKTHNWISNLRDATRHQNMQNRNKTIRNTTGYKGAFLNKKTGLYYSQIVSNKKYYFLGYFTTALEAHWAYCTKAKELSKEFANFGQINAFE